MGLRSLLILLSLFLSQTCFANQPWAEKIQLQSFQVEHFLDQVGKVLALHQQTILFAVKDESKAAVFFSDYRLTDSGVVILLKHGDGFTIGGSTDLVEESTFKSQLRQRLEKKYSKFELFVPQANADDCRYLLKTSSIESLKDVLTEQEKSAFFSWANGCGRGLLEGAIEGSTGSYQTILKLVQEAVSVSGPSDAWNKLKQIPTELNKVFKEFKLEMDKAFAGQVTLPPDAAGNLFCSFVAEYGTKGILTAITGGAGTATVLIGIKSFIEKVRRVFKVAREAKKFKEFASKVSEKYRYVISKIEKNSSITNAQFDVKNLNRHFKKHQQDIGASSAEDYAQKASALAQEVDERVLTITGPKTGAIFKFNPSTNEFIVINKTGKIETYFKPNPDTHGLGSNMEYFLSQYEKY